LGSSAQDTSKGHGALTDAQLIADTKAAYGWTADAFEIPANIKKDWEIIGSRGAADRAEWEERFASISNNKQNEFNRAFALDAPKRLAAVVRAFKKQTSEEAPKHATRKSSELGIECHQPSDARNRWRICRTCLGQTTQNPRIWVSLTQITVGVVISTGVSVNMVWPRP
jgi:transketolase